MSLQFLKIVLHNYGQFEHEEILFPEGISTFVGDNGSGKTTILDAIPFAFYGEAPNTNMDDVMYFNAPPRSHCYVELYFLFNNYRYKLVRDLKRTKNTYLALANGTMVVDSKKAVTEFVKNKLLKMDYTTFCNAFYARQKEVAALANMKQSERKDTVTKLLRFQSFDLASKMKKNERDELDTEIEKIKRENVNEEETKQKIKEFRDQASQLEQDILSFETNLKVEMVSFEQLLKEKKESDISFQLYVQIKNSIQSIKSQIESNENRNLKPNEQKLFLLLQKKEKLDGLKESKEKMEEYSKKRDELLEIKGKYEQKLKIFRDLKNIKEAFDRDRTLSLSLSKEIESSVGLKEKMKQLETVKDELHSKTDITRETIHQQELEHHELTGKVREKNEMKKTFVSLGKDSPCPTCGQALGEKHDSEIHAINNFLTQAKPIWDKQKEDIERLKKYFANLQKEQQENDKQIRSIQQSIIQFEKANANLQIVNDELKRKKQEFEQRKAEYEEYKDIQFDSELLQKVELAYQTYQNQYREFVQISTEVNQIPELQEYIEETKYIISSLKDDSLKSENQLKELNFDLEAYNQLSERINDMQESVNQKRELIHTNKLNKQSLQQKVDELVEKLERNKENNKKVIQLTKQSYLKDLLSKGMQHCKLNILKEIAPILSGEMSKDIRSLTDGRYDYVELDETFFPFMEKDGNLKPITFFSGGEESILAISLRLAISKMLAESTGQELDFLALDEVFAYLDKNRMTNVIRMLNDLSEQLSQIFVITHEDVIKDYASHTLEVRISPKGNSTTKWLKKIGSFNNEEQFEKVQQILEEYVI